MLRCVGDHGDLPDEATTRAVLARSGALDEPDRRDGRAARRDTGRFRESRGTFTRTTRYRGRGGHLPMRRSASRTLPGLPPLLAALLTTAGDVPVRTGLVPRVTHEERRCRARTCGTRRLHRDPGSSRPQERNVKQQLERSRRSPSAARAVTTPLSRALTARGRLMPTGAGLHALHGPRTSDHQTTAASTATARATPDPPVPGRRIATADPPTPTATARLMRTCALEQIANARGAEDVRTTRGRAMGAAGRTTAGVRPSSLPARDERIAAAGAATAGPRTVAGAGRRTPPERIAPVIAPPAGAAATAGRLLERRQATCRPSVPS